MTAYFCSHAFWKEGDPDNMWCDNYDTPKIVDNEKTCQFCAVGMIRRLRDDY